MQADGLMTTDRTLPVGRRQMGRCGPAHLAATAFDTRATLIWHTSSKGMPRHAHRRRALMGRVGVGLNYLHATVRCGLNFDNDKSPLFDAFGYQQKQYTLKKPTILDFKTQMA